MARRQDVIPLPGESMRQAKKRAKAEGEAGTAAGADGGDVAEDASPRG